MTNDIFSITAEGDDFIVLNTQSGKSSQINWQNLSNMSTLPNCTNECIAALLGSVDASGTCLVSISGEARFLIIKAFKAMTAKQVALKRQAAKISHGRQVRTTHRPLY